MKLFSIPSTVYWRDYFFPIVYSYILCCRLIDHMCVDLFLGSLLRDRICIAYLSIFLYCLLDFCRIVWIWWLLNILYMFARIPLSHLVLEFCLLVFVCLFWLTDSISVLAINLFIWSIFSWIVLEYCICLSICPFHLGCPISWHMTNILLLLYFFDICWTFISIFFSFKCSLFLFLMYLAKNLSILFIFSKN